MNRHQVTIYRSVRDRLRIIKAFDNLPTYIEALTQVMREACYARKMEPVIEYVPPVWPPEPAKVFITGLLPHWIWPTVGTMAGNNLRQARHRYLGLLVDEAIARRKIKIVSLPDLPQAPEIYRDEST